MSNTTEATTTPQPSPVVASADLALAAVNALRNELSIQFQSVTTRFEAMDKATALLHEDNTRVPSQIDKATGFLRELLETRIDAHDTLFENLQRQLDGRGHNMQAAIDALYNLVNEALHKEVASLDGRVNVVVATAEEQLKSVQMQFILLKQATEQLDIANKTAIASALVAQKERADETQKSSQAAIAKSEVSTSEAIKALTTTFNASVNSLSDRFLDLKGRIDRGEGRSTVVDPGVVQLAEQVRDLAKSRDTNVGMGWMVLTGISVLVALATTVMAIIGFMK